jgi:hypothetical protein
MAETQLTDEITGKAKEAWAGLKEMPKNFVAVPLAATIDATRDLTLGVLEDTWKGPVKDLKEAVVQPIVQVIAGIKDVIALRPFKATTRIVTAGLALTENLIQATGCTVNVLEKAAIRLSRHTARFLGGLLTEDITSKHYEEKWETNPRIFTQGTTWEPRWPNK